MQRRRARLFAHQSCPCLGVVVIMIGAACEAEVWREISSGDNLSYTSKSGWSGSGSDDGSATANSPKAGVLHLQPNVIQAVTVLNSIAGSQANGSNSSMDESDRQKYTHWTLTLTGVETVADYKTLDQERFMQYLNLIVNILLDVRFDKDSASFCSSSTRLLTMLPKIGKWAQVLEGAERLLEILHSCFAYSFANQSECTALANKSPGSANFSRHQFKMATLQRNASERKAGKNQTLTDTKQQLAAIRAWANRLEDPFSLVQNTSRDELQTTLTNVSLQCQLSGLQKISLAANLKTFSAAVADLLRIFADLHDFGILLNELRNWNGPLGPSSGRKNGRAPRSYDEVTFLLTDTISSLDGPRNTSQTCQVERFCTDAKKTLVYLDRLPFILPAKRLQLKYLLFLVCKNESGQERNYSGDKFSSGETACPAIGGPICVDSLILNCTEDVWVRTSNPRSSFSPELSHHDYIVRTIGSSFIDRNWSKSVSKPWCRLMCKPGHYWPKAYQLMRRVVTHVLNAILLLFVLLSCYLIFSNKRNRYGMTKNPRRAYLYINVCEMLNQYMFTLGLYTSDGTWCNSDGSLVVDSEDASVGCKLQASVKLAMDVLFITALVWAVLLWIRTMIDLQNTHKIEQEVYCLGLTAQELIEVAVITTTIFVAVVIISLPFVGEERFHFRLEGSPPILLCINVQYLNSTLLYGSYLLLNFGAGIGFFLFSKALWVLTINRQKTCGAMYRAAHQRDSQAAVMRKWLYRHSLFGTLQLIRSILYFFLWIDLILKHRNRHSFKIEVDAYIECILSFHCPQECSLKLPPTDMSPVVLALIVVTLITNLFAYLWIFFDEIEWSALSKIRPSLKI